MHYLSPYMTYLPYTTHTTHSRGDWYRGRMHFPNSKHQNKTPYKARERGCGVRSSHTFIGLVVSMATISLISGLLMLWLSVLVSETAKVQIHRTGSRSVVTPTDNESWCNFELCEYLPDISKVFSKKEAWLYSISGTILVGMAGVLPLLVISVEAGHSLREGGRIRLNLISCLRQPEPSITFSSHILK